MNWRFWRRPAPMSVLTITFDSASADIKIIPAVARTEQERDHVARNIAQVAVLLSSGQMTPYINQAIAESGMTRNRVAQTLHAAHQGLAWRNPRNDDSDQDRDAVDPVGVFAVQPPQNNKE